jgi:hypothetical protein
MVGTTAPLTHALSGMSRHKVARSERRSVLVSSKISQVVPRVLTVFIYLWPLFSEKAISRGLGPPAPVLQTLAYFLRLVLPLPQQLHSSLLGTLPDVYKPAVCGIQSRQDLENWAKKLALLIHRL